MGRAAVDNQILDQFKGPGAKRFDDQGVAVFKMTHMQLAEGGFFLRTMGGAVDHRAAHSANALPTIMVKGYWLLTAEDEPLV